MKLHYESLASIKRQIRNYVISPETKHSAITTVAITTARELSDDEYSSIIANLAKKFNSEIYLEKFIDPDIVGGIILKCGDNIIDGSVARKLKQYKDMMKGIDIKKIGVTDAV